MAMPRPIRLSISRATTPRRSWRSWPRSPSARGSIESAIYVEGISSIQPADLASADELGYRVKLLGVAVRTPKGIEQRVHPTMVRKDSAIAQVMGVTNAVTIDAEGHRPAHPGRTWRGRSGDGLGGALRHRRYRARRECGAVRPPGRRGSAPVRKAPMQRHEGGYYIRLLARDRPGHRGNHRHAAGRTEYFAGIDRAAARRRRARRRMARAGPSPLS